MRDPVGPQRKPASPTRPPGVRLSAVDAERPAVHDHLARSTPTVRIAAGRDRWPLAITALLGLFLVGALLKPWVGPGAPRSSEAVAAAPPAVTPSAGPDLLADLRTHCQDPLGWRVYSQELWLGRPVRTWRSVEPATRASGPDDPDIPSVWLGPFVDALGYCSPWTGPQRPPADATVSAWARIDGPGRGGMGGTGGNSGSGASGGLRAVLLRTIAPDVPTPLGALFGGVEGAVPGAGPDAGHASSPSPVASAASSAGSGAGTTTGWPTGHYVFALRADGWERWWVVQVAADREPPEPAGPGASAAAGSASP